MLTLIVNNKPTVSSVVYDWYPNEDSPFNLSSILLEPVSRITREGINFKKDGENFKFFGVNNCFSGCIPSKAQAVEWAKCLAFHGINVVRIHHIDDWYPSGILDNDGTSQTLHATALDLFDFFINELKSRGIYIWFCLYTYRRWVEGDGLTSIDGAFDVKDPIKAINYFDSTMVQLQKDFASNILNRVNTYTGIAYKSDPVFAVVEILNENSLWSHWYTYGYFDPLGPYSRAEVVYPDFYQDALTDLWNSWVETKYTTVSAAKTAWGLGDLVENQVTIYADHSVTGTLSVSSGAVATKVFESGVATITVTQITDTYWHIQYQKYFTQVTGKSYRWAVTLSADAEREVIINFQQANSPYIVDATRTITLTTTPTEFVLYSYASFSGSCVLKLLCGYSTGVYVVGDMNCYQYDAIPEVIAENLKDTFTFVRPYTSLISCFPAQEVLDVKEFIHDVVKDFFNGMRDHILDTIGYQGLVQCQGGGLSYNVEDDLDAYTDFYDGHTYHDHPTFPGTAWDSTNFTITNQRMITSSSLGMVGIYTSGAHQTVKTKPFTVSEYMHSYPNDYAYEGNLMMAIYGLTYLCDGLFAFDFAGSSSDVSISSYFSMRKNPQKMILMGVASYIMQKATNWSYTNSDGVIEFTSNEIVGVVGSIGGRTFNLGGITFTPDRDGAVYFYTPDASSIITSTSIVLVSVGRVRNSRSGWDEGYELEAGHWNWGGNPVQVEDIVCSVTVNGESFTTGNLIANNKGGSLSSGYETYDDLAIYNNTFLGGISISTVLIAHESNVLSATSPTAATVLVNGTTSVVTITVVDGVNWHIRYGGTFTQSLGSSYRFRATISTNTPRTIVHNFQQAASPFVVYQNTNLAITSTPTEYEVLFTGVVEAESTSCRLFLGYGTDIITISNMSLEYLGGGTSSIKNNIIKTSGDSSFNAPEGTILDYNCYYDQTGSYSFEYGGVIYTTLASYQAATGQDAHSIAANPLLDDDYTLMMGSPCVNEGTSLTGIVCDAWGSSRPLGGEYDIGAREETLKTYYVKNGGDDSLDGLSNDNAWATIAKVNAATFNPGDSVLFNRGDTWREILIAKSGTAGGSLYYGSYGSGQKPCFYGSRNKNISGDWTDEGSNIWSIIPETSNSELFSNPSFDSNTTGWFSYGSATFSFARTAVEGEYDTANGGAKISCSVPGTIEIWYPSLSIETDNWYILQFRAKSTASLDVKPIKLMLSSSPYTNYYSASANTTPTITTEWVTYKVAFFSNATSTNARIDFRFDNMIAGQILYFDTLSLKNYGNDVLVPEVGNIVFESGVGVKKWSLETCTTQGNFYYDESQFKLYLYSTSNPASFYSILECCLRDAETRLSNKSYIEFNGLCFKYFGMCGVYYGTNSHHITIKQCEEHYSGGSHQLGTVGTRYGGGFSMWGDTHDYRIEGCLVYYSYDGAYSMEGTTATVYNIYFINNISVNCERGFDWVYSGGTITNVFVLNNTFINNGYSWGSTQRPDARVGVGINTYSTKGTYVNFNIKNNLIYNCYNYAIQTWGQTDSLPDTLDYNCYFPLSTNFYKKYLTVYPTFSDYKAISGQDAHSISVDPLLNADYTLDDTSPCIDAGTYLSEVTDDYWGTSRQKSSYYDIGAYEYPTTWSVKRVLKKLKDLINVSLSSYLKEVRIHEKKMLMEISLGKLPAVGICPDTSYERWITNGLKEGSCEVLLVVVNRLEKEESIMGYGQQKGLIDVVEDTMGVVRGSTLSKYLNKPIEVEDVKYIAKEYGGDFTLCIGVIRFRCYKVFPHVLT